MKITSALISYAIKIFRKISKTVKDYRNVYVDISKGYLIIERFKLLIYAEKQKKIY